VVRGEADEPAEPDTCETSQACTPTVHLDVKGHPVRQPTPGQIHIVFGRAGPAVEVDRATSWVGTDRRRHEQVLLCGDARSHATVGEVGSSRR